MHLSMHAMQLYSNCTGAVDDSYLKEEGFFICSGCHHLVAISHSISHHAKCSRRNDKYPNSNFVTLSATSDLVSPSLK